MKCWSFFRVLPLGAIVLRVRGSPGLGKFPMNLGKHIEDTGKGRLGERGLTAHSLLEVASQSSLHLSLLAVLTPYPADRPFHQDLQGWVLGDGCAPHQLGTRNGREGRMAIFSPLLDRRRSAVANTHCYVNGLKPRGKLWKLRVNTSIYPTHA